MVARFDWDAGNREKCQTHGVSIEDIEHLFGSDPRIAPDPGHSQNEDRLIAVGRTANGRAMFVAFTLRQQAGEQLIRPVSARFMHSKEVAKYEQKASPAED